MRTVLQRFLPHSSTASFAEKLRSGLVGGLAIFLLAWALYALPRPTYPLLMLGSMAEPMVTPEALDIAWALEQMDGVIDVSVEDLADIFAKAQTHARDRLNTQLKKNV
jgi:CBS-domain-containing membrane protein